MKLRLSHSERRRHLVWQISLGMVAILLTTTVLALQYIHYYTMSILSERDEKIAFDQLQSAQNRITQIFDDLYSSVNLLLYDGDILTIARERKTNMDYDYYSHVNNIHTRLANMSLDNAFIHSIYVYINDNALISTAVTNSIMPYTSETIPIMQSNFYQEICQSVYRTSFSTGHNSSDFHAYKNFTSEKASLITLGCASNNTLENGKRVIMINISVQMIATLLEECFGEDSLVYLLDENQQLLCSTNASVKTDLISPLALPESESMMGQFPITLNDKTGQAVYIRSENGSFTIVKYIPDHENRKDATALEIVFLSVSVLCSIISLLLVQCWTRRCLTPLNVICKKMAELEIGRLGVQIDLAPRNELGNVIRHFNRMSQALAEMDEEKRRTERSLRVQEIHALRAQLNPHFIFNVLNMLKWMAVARHADDLEECIVALAEILYPVFREKSETTPLRQEIHYLEKYLLILSHQFGRQVNLNISFDPELGNIPVPQLILQPIVENCVRHGYYADGRTLTVTVMAQTENGVLEISVVDNGRGITADKLKQLQSSIELKECIEADDGNHIGLSNVHRRIALHYGQQYGLRIWSVPWKGTTVKIRLPLPKEI